MPVALLHDRVGAPTYTGKPGNPAWYRLVKSLDFGLQLSGFGFTAQGFSCASAHRRVVGFSTLGVLTASRRTEEGNRTSCNVFF